MWMLCLHACMSTNCELGAPPPEVQKRASDPLELALWMVVNHQVGVENWALVLWAISLALCCDVFNTLSHWPPFSPLWSYGPAWLRTGNLKEDIWNKHCSFWDKGAHSFVLRVSLKNWKWYKTIYQCDLYIQCRWIHIMQYTHIGKYWINL